MTKNMRCLLIFGLLLVASGVMGQSTASVPDSTLTLSIEEVKSLKTLAAYNSRWNTFLNVWALLGPILAGLVTYFGLKKKVEDWAEKEITKKAQEKFGVDWSIVNQLVVEKRRDINIKAKRIAVVNKTTGRRQPLVNLLEKAGFKNIQFFKLDEFGVKFDYNQFDLVILDNHDNTLSEPDMKNIIDNHDFPYVCFTVNQTSNDFFSRYNGKVKFARFEQNIPDYIAQSF